MAVLCLVVGGALVYGACRYQVVEKTMKKIKYIGRLCFGTALSGFVVGHLFCSWDVLSTN